MCWSGEASAALATIGAATTAYAAYKNEPRPLWLALGYFTLMEGLQAYTYAVIDECSAPANQVATLLGYLHIVFQPFFINMLSLHFVPEHISRKISPIVFFICFFSAIFMLVQLYPFSWAGHCNDLRPLCGDALCSFSGNWHIAWSLPLNGIGNIFVGIPILEDGFVTYVLASFLLPILYGSWRVTTYHYVMGPFLALQLTNNINEWPAIWCLLSIGLLLIVIKTPLRQILYVNNYDWWRFKKYKKPREE